MPWVQTYDPAGSWLLSSFVAGLPIVVLLSLLLMGLSAPRAALAGLATALVVATAFFGMPAKAAAAAAGYGAAFGLLPIGWIVFSAVFLFHLTVRSGQFEIVKQSVAAISPDRRVQALLIAFCFGTFLEGAAGFGTPVAISAAILIGIGFSPLYAAGLALLANTSPVAFGALGTPITTLGEVSGIDQMLLSQMAGRQLPFVSLIIPLWMIWAMAGWKGVKGCWPVILVCGGSFAGIQFAASNFHGPMLVDVFGGIGSLVVTTIFLQFWQPAEIWWFPGEQSAQTPEVRPSLGSWKTIYAWSPWIILSAIVFLWGWPAWKTMLDGGTKDDPNVFAGVSRLTFDAPALHRQIYRTSPVVDVPEGSDRAAAAEAAVFNFNWLSTTGTGIFLAAVLSALWLRISPVDFLKQFFETLMRVRWALLTIACMLALAFTTKYSGADVTLGLAFTRSGWLYPFFAPLLGWLGVALTGSDTSANALFGSLQRITATQLGLNPVLIVASNSTGGVMGKMIDAQSIVVAAVATQQTGNEGRILRFVFPHSLALALLIGALTLLQAYALPWMIPAEDNRTMESVRVSDDRHSFVREKSGQPFAPWGFNYDHDDDGRLIEDYWDTEWPKIEEDFREMKQLGANVVRVHLQLARFMKAANEPNEENLKQFSRLLALAEKEGLRLDITGLGCYHKKDVPAWYDDLDEAGRWTVQARFWAEISKLGAESPAVFCYDLMNEPVVPAGDRQPRDWLGPPFGESTFVQCISLSQGDRPRWEIAKKWIATLSDAIRKHDRRHMITVGLVDWSLDRPGLTSGFIPEKIADQLDFLCVHLYPQEGKEKDGLATLAGFAVGKPIVIEETFPLACPLPKFEKFLDDSKTNATGWFGFYWGKTPAECRKSTTIPDAMMLGWLEFFQKNAAKFTD